MLDELRALADRLEQEAAPGCALNTTALPAATIEMALHAIVEIGLVDGMIEPITP